MKILTLIFALISFNSFAAIETHIKDAGDYGSVMLINKDALMSDDQNKAYIHGKYEGDDTYVEFIKDHENNSVKFEPAKDCAGYNHISTCGADKIPFDICPKNGSYAKQCIEKALFIYNEYNCNEGGLAGNVWRGEIATECTSIK